MRRSPSEALQSNTDIVLLDIKTLTEEISSRCALRGVAAGGRERHLPVASVQYLGSLLPLSLVLRYNLGFTWYK